MGLYFAGFSTKHGAQIVNPPPDSSAPAGPPQPPPVLPAAPVPAGKASPLRILLALLLTLFLGFTLANSILSLLDDSFMLLLGLHTFTGLEALVGGLGFLLLLAAYFLIGLTPAVPKRVVLPIIFFNLLGTAVGLPIIIYHYQWYLQVDMILAVLQILLVLVIAYTLRADGRLRWPVVAVRHLGQRRFSLFNLLAFVALNGLVLLPVGLFYLAFCAHLAVGHFTDGFIALRPGGIVMQARTYVRDDGKKILLFPMSHVADSEFYKSVAQSVSSNAVVLLEGVTDEKNLLTNHLSYRRAAKSLGLAEQHDELDIRQGELVRADVDIQVFSSNTIAVLNLVSALHAKGLTPDTLRPLLQYSPPPALEQELLADLLLKRNEHVLGELRARLPHADDFVIPWGAAHMPGLAAAVQKAGFHLSETHEYVSIAFGKKAKPAGAAGTVKDSGTAK